MNTRPLVPDFVQFNALDPMVHHQSRGFDNGFVPCMTWKATISSALWKIRWEKTMPERTKDKLMPSIQCTNNTASSSILPSVVPVRSLAVSRLPPPMILHPAPHRFLFLDPFAISLYPCISVSWDTTLVPCHCHRCIESLPRSLDRIKSGPWPICGLLQPNVCYDQGSSSLSCLTISSFSFCLSAPFTSSALLQ